MTEIEELLNEVKLGNKQALDTFIKKNLKLVKYIANFYTNRGVEYDDLVQEGMIGLYKAIYKYNPTMNSRFSLYASFWIKKHMREAIQKTSRTIYIPKLTYDKITYLKRCINELTIKLNRFPTLEEVVEKTNISEKEITLIYNSLNNVSNINNIAEYVWDENGKILEELNLEELIIVDEKSLDERIEDNEKREKIIELFNKSNLSERAIKILKLRHGFYDGITYKLEEIAKMLGVSFQAVQQCEASAIQKIKKNKNLIELASYLDMPKDKIKEIEKYIESKNNSKKLRKKFSTK